MPAIQVARTDTFEQQRQKINQIGSTLFNITSGGSDLSTDKLTLGNGSLSSPSLSFVTEPNLGFYRPQSQTIGIVSNSRRVFEFSNASQNSYRNISLIQSSLQTSGISIISYGQNYDAGSYSNIPILGGSGDDGVASITVDAYIGTITNNGYGYLSFGNYSSVGLSGGTGSGAIANFSIEGITGTITSPGSGYTNDIYLDVPLTTNGSGTNAKATVTILNGEVTDFIVTSIGSGYVNGDTLSFIASSVGGTGSGFLFTINSNPSRVSNFSFVSKGSNYLTNQILTLPGVVSGVSTNLKGIVYGVSTTLSTASVTITVASTSGIVQGMLVTVDSGLGELLADTTVSLVNSSTELTLSANPTVSGAAVLNFSSSGNINEISVVNASNIVPGSLVSQTSGTGSLGTGVTVISVNTTTNKIILSSQPTTAGTAILDFSPPWGSASTPFQYTIGTLGVISTFLISSGGYGYQINDTLSIDAADLTQAITYNVTTSSNRYYIDSVESPNLTLYVGNTYIFNISDVSNSGNPFKLSKFPGGKWGSSLIENISSTLTAGSSTVVVSSATGIVSGMEVTVTSGTGQLSQGTIVESIVGLTVTLSKPVFASGAAILKFSGTEYTTGVEITSTYIKIKVTSVTPSALYYYSDTNPNFGGASPTEAVLTINANNPKTFGSGFSAIATTVSSAIAIDLNVETGSITSNSLVTSSANVANITSTSIISQSLTSNQTITPKITSNSTLDIDSPSVYLTGNLQISSVLSINSTSGNLITSGYLKTSNILNINDALSITNNNIASSFGTDVIITPPVGRVLKVNNNTAITIPSGSTAQRPSGSVVSSGSIRFNTDTNQYEGYSGTTSSWSSLGGVRDLDGNTYITAEFTIGSNDNTLWFYNDNNNTVKFTPEYQEFANVKKVRSINTSAPAYINWTANTPVTVGQYLKYRNNIYEVVTAGVTGSSGNEPTSITGTNFANGTATLKFFITAVGPLTFQEISEVRIAPDGGTSLSINNDLRFETNVISTDTNDLLLRPNSGKKVTVDAKTSLVLPVGTTNERGAPVIGSVRFNTTILQYEGYDGANWSSLGGVRDVDGNTYIIPELTPGGNQNILYFYNNGSNTLRVTENEIQLDTIDTIASPTSNSLNLEASLVTFNNLAASIDTSSTTRTFISTTKDNLDLGLSSGLVNDPLLRLSDTGDIFYNLGFGTGVFNGVKIFDKELKELELADYKILTEDVTLTKNIVNVGSFIVYDPSIHRSAKVQIVAHNETTGDKEFVEYSVIDKGSDIFHTDFGNVKTGAELILSVFDFDANNRVRVTFTLDSAISAGNVVKVTVISNIIKR